METSFGLLETFKTGTHGYVLPQPHGSGVGLSEVTFSGSGLTIGTPNATVGQDNITTQGQAGQETQLRLNQISYDPEGYKN